METVRQFEVEAEMSVEALVKGFSGCGFGARRLAEAVGIYELMLSEDHTRFLSLSGAMVPAGLRNIISSLIRWGYVDVLVTTGANLVHDIIESFGCHCLGSPDSNDVVLRESGISRIYDVFINDENFVKFEELMQEMLPCKSEAISGTELMRLLGSQVTDKSSILRSAHDCQVPVFCPAISDSMLGLQAWLRSQTRKVSVDAIADIKQIVDICYESPRAGIVIVGGGVPKNFALQAMMVTPNSFVSAIQLTTDTPENGGLSGATLSEAISWGKISSDARYVTVYGDATITFPIMVAATLSRLKKNQGARKC